MTIKHEEILNHFLENKYKLIKARACTFPSSINKYFELFSHWTCLKGLIINITFFLVLNQVENKIIVYRNVLLWY